MLLRVIAWTVAVLFSAPLQRGWRERVAELRTQRETGNAPLGKIEHHREMEAALAGPNMRTRSPPRRHRLPLSPPPRALKTQRQRLTRKLSALNEEAKRRRHEPVRDQHRWLCQVLRGHYAYFGLPSNFRALQAFAHHVRRIWFRALYRRSQRRLTGAAFQGLLDRFPLPKPRITHPCFA